MRPVVGSGYTGAESQLAGNSLVPLQERSVPRLTESVLNTSTRLKSWKHSWSP